MAAAPAMGDHLCEACQAHFKTCRAVLDQLDVSFEIDNRLVRGLDYYTRTTFEIQTSALGAQSAVAGGGRYDGLMAALGGPPLPATGFAIGLDRLVEIVAQSVPGAADGRQRLPDLFVAALGSQSQERACLWIAQLADKGVWAEMDLEDRSLKSQMKRADRLGAPWTLIVGERELAEGALVLRNMLTKQQQSVSLETVVPELLEQLVSNAAGHPESA
jgi:histidyl-tRNA synthetase